MYRRVVNVAGACYGVLSLLSCRMMTIPSLLVWVVAMLGGRCYGMLVAACFFASILADGGRMAGPCSPPWTGSVAEQEALFRERVAWIDRLFP